MRKAVIVAVDDEPIVLDAIGEQLTRGFGGAFDVELAQDAGEALEVLDELAGDDVAVPLVISDHIMPGTKGDELLIEVHARLPLSRKILLTGQAGLDAVSNIVNHGALYRYIGKPWDREDLMLTVREATESFFRELEVERQRQELLRTHAVTTRFVPMEFLKLLGRERLVEVSRLDHVELEMNVLFTDIRGYTSIVEGHSGAENFAFINEYLTHMEPPLSRHGGFIDHYAGDGALVLFPGPADEALKAGIESFAALERLNTARVAAGRRPVSIGAGLNSGRLMMGVIGGEDRLSAGVIGDPVNLAARLETLTRQVGAKFLISGATRDRLARPDDYALRLVDRVRVKGRTAPAAVHEVLDVLPSEARDLRLSTRDRFETARSLFDAARFAEARAAFADVLATDPDDTAAAVHVQRCEQFVATGVPDGWDGVVLLDRK